MSRDPKSDPPPLVRRLAWFAGLWLAGVATLAAVAFVLRSLIIP